jgi:hypothetical protein
VENNTISGNEGGAMALCHGTIRNNTITGNFAAWGEFPVGTLHGCDGIVENNTIVGNRTGLVSCKGTIRNCIIWGNIFPEGPQLTDSSVPTYSCIQHWTGGGEGNIAFFPYFVDAANGDHHLKTWSRCIDAGDPSSDFSNEPEPNGGRVNMGAYGNTPEAASKSPDVDADGLPDDWELLWLGDLAYDGAGDPDGDRIVIAAEYRYGWNPTAAAETLVENRTKSAWYEGIQAALSECDDGDEIVAHPGLYKENIHFGGKNVILRSTDPLDPLIVENTVIDGNAEGSVVSFAGAEDETCILSGFTITNGDWGTRGSQTHATIQNNIITGNSGGGLLWCDGMIRNNAISGNSASYGGGLDRCDGIIQNNIISGNSAIYDGGGLHDCDGIIQNNVISGNTARWAGGGLTGCSGTIQNNTISGNSAETRGGALNGCSGTILNCIIWGNTAPEGAQVYQSTRPTYSCIQGWTTEGDGNINLHPRFVDAESGDFRLRADSPCIDAGFNGPELPETDIAGMHRIMYGGKCLTVDMGAYEYYINRVSPGPEPGQTTLTWSSLWKKTYSIFYSDDLLDWQLADGNVPSADSQITSWTDDGSKTGGLPSLAPRRFYRILENP